MRWAWRWHEEGMDEDMSARLGCRRVENRQGGTGAVPVRSARDDEG